MLDRSGEALTLPVGNFTVELVTVSFLLVSNTVNYFIPNNFIQHSCNNFFFMVKFVAVGLSYSVTNRIGKYIVDMNNADVLTCGNSLLIQLNVRLM